MNTSSHSSISPRCRDRVSNLYLIRRATFFSLSLILPTNANAAESNTQYFIQWCKYCINCSRPMFVGRVLQTGGCCRRPIRQEPPTLFSRNLNISSRDRRGSGPGCLLTFFCLLFGALMCPTNAVDTRTPNCFLRGSSRVMQLNLCLLSAELIPRCYCFAAMRNLPVSHLPEEHSSRAESPFENAQLKCNDIFVSSDPRPPLHAAPTSLKLSNAERIISWPPLTRQTAARSSRTRALVLWNEEKKMSKWQVSLLREIST